jgi:hypothetical protein
MRGWSRRETRARDYCSRPRETRGEARDGGEAVARGEHGRDRGEATMPSEVWRRGLKARRSLESRARGKAGFRGKVRTRGEQS